jgi:ABC-type multidrug transport system fused ATPase/permease subunit
MSFSDFIYRPFETLIRPLDIPATPLPASGPFALLLHFARMFRGVLVAVTLLMVAIEGINLATIWGISFVVDGVSAKGAAVFLQQGWRTLAVLGVLIFPVLPLLIFLGNTLNSQAVAVCMPAAMQWQGHKAVERQDLAFFHDLFAGQVASRISQVASAVQQQIVVSFYRIPLFLVQFVGSLILLATLSWPLAVPVFVWIAANIALAVAAVPHFSERSRRTARARSLIAIGFWGLVAGFVTLGQFVASIAIVQRLNANSRTFLQMGQQIFQAVGTIRDAMPVVTTPPTIKDAQDAGPLAITGGEVEFENIRFEYRQGQEVIEDLSLTVQAGEKVGLVGLSGAGKSTLVSLLLRFFDLKEGAIRIDGQDIRSVTQASLRESIGVVTQDVSLLHRSVGDNIRYGRPDASREEVERGAMLAEADGFIADLKDSEGRAGYDAFVGDRGVKLSGGQRQRVAIARVLLKDAPILVLDEATSALDSEAEAAVQGKLALLMEGKTVIAIAHRLSTIARMDRIVVLDKGRIVEEGTPSALLERDGLYARLWRRQTGGYIADAIEET